MVLVNHKRSTSFDLSLHNGIPKLLSLDGLAGTSFLFIPLIQFLEFSAVHVVETGSFVGAEKRPIAIRFDSLHAMHEISKEERGEIAYLQKIWDPKGIEKVTGTGFLLAVVLAQIQELENVGVPWLDVNGKGTGTLVSSLVDITRSGVISTEHGDNPVRVTIGSSDVRPITCVRYAHKSAVHNSPSGTDIMNVEANTTSSLADHGTVLEGIVDSFYGVVLHADKEA